MHVSTFHPALQFNHTISQTQIPFLDITLRVSGSTISISGHYKDTDTHNYLHYTSSHSKHCKMVFRIPSSCASAVSALGMMTSCRNAKRCPPFSKAVAIPRIHCRMLGKECPPLPAKKHSRKLCVRTKDSSGPDIPLLEFVH